MFPLAEGLLLALGAYFALGAGLASVFVVWGAPAIDPAAKKMPIMARLLILPGAAALWPLMLVRWMRRQAPPTA